MEPELIITQVLQGLVAMEELFLIASIKTLFSMTCVSYSFDFTQMNLLTQQSLNWWTAF